VSEGQRSEPFPHPPGVVAGRRGRARRSYELLTCGWRGHALVGTDAAELAQEDHVYARESGGLRWHRCLRCDTWIPHPKPDPATHPRAPRREEIELPLRGKPLRDKIVLRVIAVDRALHFVILGLLAIGLFLFAAHRADLRGTFFRLVTDLQGGVGGGPIQTSETGIVHELDRLFTLKTASLDRIGVVVAAYALLEGVEAVGLWLQKRWAEYLTFIATTALLPLEVYELSNRVSWFKLFAFVLNVAVVVYLIYAKRLFGVRGGARVDEREREQALGWGAIDRATPPTGSLPLASGATAGPVGPHAQA